MAVRTRLIELRPEHESEREITLYLKGFLSRGEKPEHFDHWLACHKALEESHSWGPRAFGYHWQSGGFSKRSVAVAVAKGAVDLARVLRNVRRATSLGHLGLIAGEQLLTISVLFVHQYLVTARNSLELADQLASHLRAFSEQWAKVRVVAHSLGCQQVIEAVASLPPELRPEEIHLCAPAVRENDVAEKLSGLARGPTFLYYTKKDRVLDVGFTPLARGRALGFAGPREAYPRLIAIDASEHFDFRVHGEYKIRFARLVPKAASREVSPL